MGNAIESFIAGFFDSISKLFSSPLDFLTGKSCSSVCGSPWDFICFVEHFCVANLVKIAIVLILSYFLLLFIYMLYKVGFFHCISHGLCRILWGCVSCWFSSCKFLCRFLCSTLLNPEHRRRRKQRTEDAFYTGDDAPPAPRRSTNRRREERLRKSLRPTRSHRVRVGVTKDRSSSGHCDSWSRSSGLIHGVRVSRASRFALKGSKHRRQRTRTRVVHRHRPGEAL